MNIRHKLIIPASYMIIGMCGIYLSMYQISLLRIAQTLELSNFMMGTIVALQYAGLCLPPLFLGTLCERIGRRGVIMVSVPFMILGMFLVSMTSGLAFFIIGIILIGAGFSVTEGTLTATLGVEFSEHSTLHIGMSQAVFSLGAVASPFICEALFDAGWEYNALFGVVSAILLVLFALFLATKQQKDVKGIKEAEAGGAFRFFKYRIFSMMAIAMLVYVGAEEMISFFTDSFFKLTLNAPAFSALSLSLFWAGMIPTRMLLGVIKRRHKQVIIGCAVGIAASILVILLVPVIPVKIAGYCVLGAFCGPCWPLIMDMTAKKYPQSAGTVSNVMISVGGFGGAIMPIITGAFISGMDFTPVFLVSIACAAIMAAMFLFNGRKQKVAE